MNCPNERKTVLIRNTEQELAIYQELAGRLESCDIPNLDKFTLTLFMAIADRERELIGIRTKGALVQKIKRSGQWRTAKAQAAENSHSRPASAMIKQMVQQGCN